MALFRKNKSPEERAQKNKVDSLYADRREEGRITVRVIDAQSGLRVIENVFAVRMLDEGERRLFMNDYTPTIGKVVGDVVILTAHGEEAFRGISGFYKLQHNLFTLLIEEHLGGEHQTK